MLTVIDEEKHPSEHRWLGLLVYFFWGGGDNEGIVS